MAVYNPRKHCGGKRVRDGGKCTRPKGWGTDHPGSGKCKKHGGSTESGRKAAGREAALSFAAGALGAAVATNPLDAMQQSVDLAAGLVSYYRHEISAAAMKLGGEEDKIARERIELLRPQYTDAIKLEQDTAKAAIGAGIAERRQRLAEAQAEMLAMAIADGLREVFGELATNSRRAAFAQVVRRRLLVLEAGTIETSGTSLPRAG